MHISKLSALSIAAATFFCSEAYSQDYCRSILEFGVHDREHISDRSQNYKYVKRAFCSKSESTNGSSSDEGFGGFWDGVGIEGETSKSNFSRQLSEYCKEDIDIALNNIKYDSLVETVNQGIVKAWTHCIGRDNRYGLAHKVTLSSDPSQFYYRIWFNRIKGTNIDSTYIKSWSITNSPNCAGSITNNTMVDEVGLELICVRDPMDTVSISAVGEVASADIRAIELPGTVEYLGPDCASYMLGREETVACNGRTKRGYYWKIGQKREHYSAQGISPVGGEKACGPNNVGSSGVTARFPYAHRNFLSVYENITNNSQAMTAPKCNYRDNGVLWTDKDWGKHCGIFEAICLKQP